MIFADILCLTFKHYPMLLSVITAVFSPLINTCTILSYQWISLSLFVDYCTGYFSGVQQTIQLWQDNKSRLVHFDSSYRWQKIHGSDSCIFLQKYKMFWEKKEMLFAPRFLLCILKTQECYIKGLGTSAGKEVYNCKQDEKCCGKRRINP